MEPPATGTISLIRQSKERDGDIEYIALCEKKDIDNGHRWLLVTGIAPVTDQALQIIHHR
jgi:hypothetical protein